MTYNDLISFFEKTNRRAAILDADFKILWDKEGFFAPWIINFPEKEAFFDRREVIISIGTGKNKIPVRVTKFMISGISGVSGISGNSGGETYYICEAYSRDVVSELVSKSEIADLLKNYLTGINDKIQNIQFFAEQCVSNPLVQSDKALLEHYKTQTGAAFDLLALSTNMNFYFNTFSYSDNKSKINIFKTTNELVKKCNKLMERSVILFNSKENDGLARIHERVYTVVFLNLIQNALLYSKPESKIDVGVFYDTSQNSVTVSVTNEIAEDAKPDSERLGIGLPLIERIVADLNGKMTGERENNTYKARITLPLYARGDDERTRFEHGGAEFITQNDSYVKRYLNRFIQK